LERLRGVAVWAYHSKGDDVYDVRCSEELVESLLLENGGVVVVAMICFGWKGAIAAVWMRLV